MTQKSNKGDLLLLFGLAVFLVGAGALGSVAFIKLNPNSFVTQFLVPAAKPATAPPPAPKVEVPQEVQNIERAKEALDQPLLSYDTVVKGYDGSEDANTLLLAAKAQFYKTTVKELTGDVVCWNSERDSMDLGPVIIAINDTRNLTEETARLRVDLGRYVVKQILKDPVCNPIETQTKPEQVKPDSTETNPATKSPATEPPSPTPEPTPSVEETPGETSPQQ